MTIVFHIIIDSVKLDYHQHLLYGRIQLNTSVLCKIKYILNNIYSRSPERLLIEIESSKLDLGEEECSLSENIMKVFF